MTLAWRLTLQELIDIARGRGLQLKKVLNLKSPDGTGHVEYLEAGGVRIPLPGIDRDDPLEPEVVESFCNLFRLRYEDFGLDPP